MRLLNTTSLRLEEFFDDNVRNYVILFHRLEKEEITFRDLRDGRGVEMAGYCKIMGCCAQAVSDCWPYNGSIHAA
jgi:hypothetical protein